MPDIEPLTPLTEAQFRDLVRQLRAAQKRYQKHQRPQELAVMKKIQWAVDAELRPQKKERNNDDTE